MIITLRVCFLGLLIITPIAILGQNETNSMNVDSIAEQRLIHILSEIKIFSEKVESGDLKGREKFIRANRLAEALRTTPDADLEDIELLNDNALIDIAKNAVSTMDDDTQIIVERQGALATVVVKQQTDPNTTQADFQMKIALDVITGTIILQIAPP